MFRNRLCILIIIFNIVWCIQCFNETKLNTTTKYFSRYTSQRACTRCSRYVIWTENPNRSDVSSSTIVRRDNRSANGCARMRLACEIAANNDKNNRKYMIKYMDSSIDTFLFTTDILLECGINGEWHDVVVGKVVTGFYCYSGDISAATALLLGPEIDVASTPQPTVTPSTPAAPDVPTPSAIACAQCSSHALWRSNPNVDDQAETRLVTEINLANNCPRLRFSCDHDYYYNVVYADRTIQSDRYKYPISLVCNASTLLYHGEGSDIPIVGVYCSSPDSCPPDDNNEVVLRRSVRDTAIYPFRRRCTACSTSTVRTKNAHRSPTDTTDRILVETINACDGCKQMQMFCFSKTDDEATSDYYIRYADGSEQLATFNSLMTLVCGNDSEWHLHGDEDTDRVVTELYCIEPKKSDPLTTNDVIETIQLPPSTLPPTVTAGLAIFTQPTPLATCGRCKKSAIMRRDPKRLESVLTKRQTYVDELNGCTRMTIGCEAPLASDLANESSITYEIAYDDGSFQKRAYDQPLTLVCNDDRLWQLDGAGKPINNIYCSSPEPSCGLCDETSVTSINPNASDASVTTRVPGTNPIDGCSTIVFYCQPGHLFTVVYVDYATYSDYFGYPLALLCRDDGKWYGYGSRYQVIGIYCSTPEPVTTTPKPTDCERCNKDHISTHNPDANDVSSTVRRPTIDDTSQCHRLEFYCDHGYKYNVVHDDGTRYSAFYTEPVIVKCSTDAQWVDVVNDKTVTAVYCSSECTQSNHIISCTTTTTTTTAATATAITNMVDDHPILTKVSYFASKCSATCGPVPNANDRTTIIFPETELIDGCLRSYAFCDTNAEEEDRVDNTIYYTIEYGYEQSYTAVFLTPITLICGNDHRWYWNGQLMTSVYCGDRRKTNDEAIGYNLIDNLIKRRL